MRSDDQASASLTSKSRTPARMPGAWQAAVIAILSALLAGYLGRPGDTPSRATAKANVSRVAEVAPRDQIAALNTTSITPSHPPLMAERDSCGRRLAWVTVVRAPGEPSGRIRLQSGSYVSPVFELTGTPVRVAIPFPAPYATGHGTIAVVGTTDAIVALTPSWHVRANAGIQAREVSWTPVAGCPTAGH